MSDIVFIGVSILLALPSLLQFLSALSYKRGRFIGNLTTHVRTQISSGRVWLPLSCIGGMILLPFSLAAGNPAVNTVVLCICGGQLLNWMTPPSLLLLGVSGSRCNELLPVLPALFPVKFIHLLRDNYGDSERGYDLKLHTLFTTSRTSGAIAWEKVVSIYLKSCEKVLVDLRQHSGNLHVELSMIASMNDKTKVLFLVDGETSGTEFPLINSARRQVCTSVNDAVWRLKTGY